MRLNEKTIIAAIILSAAFFIAPKMVLAEIIFNEIMYDLPSPGTDDKREWIELYNSGSLPIDLTGWKFNDGDNHILNLPPEKGSLGSLIIDTNGYLLLASDATTLAGNLPSYTGAIIDTVMSLNNTSAQLKMLNKDNVEMASASYNKTMGANGNGKTLEWDGAALKESLIDGGTPGRVNSVLSSDGTATSAAPSGASPTATATSVATASPTPASGYQYSQKVFINEFLPWPASGDKEWVELVNLDGAVINLSGWQIDDADNSTAPQVIPADTTIAASGFLVVSFNKNTLNNDGDKIRLLWPDDQLVHVIEYGKATQGQAAAKFDSGWLWTNQPTPGQTNKKSFTEKNETISLSVAPNSANKIVATEDVVAVQASAPRVATPVNQKIITPTVTSPENSPIADWGAPESNLLAAAANKPTGAAKNNSIFALIGVLFLAAVAGGGLIYFRRQKQVDIEEMDD